jgi:ABC-type thiamine transport system ATPase subunit
MLLDDIFSALDPATMKTIMTKLFSSQGLFRKLKTTVIIVSNDGKTYARYSGLSVLILGDHQIFWPVLQTLSLKSTEEA